MSVAVYDALNTAIYGVLNRQTNRRHSLDQYLLALWYLACEYRDQPAIPAEQFVTLLAQALVTEAPKDLTPKACDPKSEFAGFQNSILGFARDFAEVKHLPQDDPFSFHGWMNTQPGSYLERGVDCVFGDALVDEVTWNDFCAVLYWGKYYE
jgi:hypothetical protein